MGAPPMIFFVEKMGAKKKVMGKKWALPPFLFFEIMGVKKNKWALRPFFFNGRFNKKDGRKSRKMGAIRRKIFRIRVIHLPFAY